jgi:hypothetical protein
MLYLHRLINRSVSVITASLALTSGIFAPASAQTNGVQRQYWSNISGTTVANLTSNANYPNSPTSTGTVSNFEGPTNTADNYGCRYRGFIVPPTTGSYTFWIASDDNSELWLSTSSDPASAARIASVSGYCNSRQWTKYSSQQSAAITLQAGQHYYIEALHKDGSQNDNLAVGWQGPGITGDAERPIPGNRLRVWTGTQYTLTVNNDGHGTTTPSGASAITAGVTRSISATPATGYQFSNWTVVSGSATIQNANSASASVTMWSGNAVIRANFTAVNYTLTMTSDGNGTTTPTGSVSVQAGVAQTITATPSSGISFANWTVTSGTATIANASSAATTVSITSNATIRANFTQAAVNLTIANDGHGTTTPSGTVSVTPGVAQAITATPANGYTFTNWSVTSGTATIANPNSAVTTVSITANATIRANFTAVTYVLTVTNDGNGTTAPSGVVTVPQGGAQTISAIPSGGFVFANWTVVSGSAAIANPSLASTTVTLSSGNATIRADFIAGQPVQPNNRRVAIAGTLADVNGNPVGTPTAVTIAVQVNIMASASGGTPLYTETFQPQDGRGISVENGRFIVTLGTGVTSADLATVLAENADCFAEITILGENPDTLLPRTPITASPYSLGISAAPAEMHGISNPGDLNISAKIGTYYVNDSDGTTYVRVHNGWKLID